MTEIAVRAHVLGRVQGVGFRAWTVEQAERLGVRGTVRNLRDGAVEIVAVGPEGAVMALLDACRAGPSFAEVSGIDAAPEPDAGPFAGFRQVG